MTTPSQSVSLNGSSEKMVIPRVAGRENFANGDRIRRDVVSLEAAWQTIVDYAVRQELIFEFGDLGYIGMRSPQFDGNTPRAQGTIEAMNWLRGEIRRSQARLRKHEKSHAHNATPDKPSVEVPQ